MVKNDFDTRRLELELSFPALQLDVRVNVQIRDQLGQLRNDLNDRVVAQAVSETLQLHADLFRFEVTDGLPKNKRARDVAFDTLSAALDGVSFSARWQEHNWDQLDLFDRAEYGPVHNLMSHGLLESPTDVVSEIAHEPNLFDAGTGKPISAARARHLKMLD